MEGTSSSWCFNPTGEKGVFTHKYPEYQKRWGAHVIEMDRVSDKLDKVINALAMICLISCYAMQMQGLSAPKYLNLAAQGLLVAGTFISIVRLVCGVHKLACNAGKDDMGNGREWEKRNMVKVAADIMLTLARLAVFVFALQQLGALKLGAHEKWLRPTMYSLFAAATIAFLACSYHKVVTSRGKDGKADYVGDLGEGLTLIGETGLVAIGPTPAGLAFGFISLTSYVYGLLKECCSKHPAADLVRIPPEEPESAVLVLERDGDGDNDAGTPEVLDTHT